MPLDWRVTAVFFWVMANDLKKRNGSREELIRKFTPVEQAGNRILVSAAGAAGLGGAFAGGDGAMIGAIVGAFAGFFLGHHPHHRRHLPD
jgi:outer membrane lipoprotein SlyB